MHIADFSLKDCGRAQYWDIPHGSEKRAKDLASYLDSPVTIDVESFAGSSSNSNLSTPPLSHLSSTRASGRHDISEFDTPNESATLPAKSVASLASVSPRYLELCINTGSYFKRLAEIDISNVISDGELFQKIANVYHHKRNVMLSICLKLPKWTGKPWLEYEIGWSFRKSSAVIFRKVWLPKSLACIDDAY